MFLIWLVGMLMCRPSSSFTYEDRLDALVHFFPFFISYLIFYSYILTLHNSIISLDFFTRNFLN